MRKLILFLSSYIPLYILLIGKDIFNRISRINDFNILTYNYKTIKFFNELNDYMVTFLLILTIVSLIGLMLCLKSGTNKNLFKIIDFENESGNYYYNYIGLYFLSSVGLSISNAQDIFILFSIMTIIGFIYIVNDLMYINPVMSLMGYKIYSMELESMIGNHRQNKIIILKSNIENNIRRDEYIKISSGKKYSLLDSIEY